MTTKDVGQAVQGATPGIIFAVLVLLSLVVLPLLGRFMRRRREQREEDDKTPGGKQR